MVSGFVVESWSNLGILCYPIGMGRRRGLALIGTLFILVVLLMVCLALIQWSRTRNIFARSHYEGLAALYAAEAGVADVYDQLSQDRNWTTGFSGQLLANQRGSYSVRFNTSGAPFQADDSINNLAGAAAKDGPRGPGTVAPGTAVVVVTGRSGAAQRVLEVVLRQDTPVGLDGPVLVDGTIRLEGNVVVQGRDGVEAVPAGIHSNSTGASGPAIQWTPLAAGDQALISGDVTTVDPRPANVAINFGTNTSAYDLGGVQTGAPAQAGPQFDVPAIVAGHRTHPAPVIVAGTTQLAAGKYYLSGNQTIPADLVLEDGVELYVEGNLDIQGAVRGEGSLYVSGSTHLRGDANVDADNKVALVSHGDVHLEGYDGTAFLKSLPGGPALLAEIQTAQDAVLAMTADPTAAVPPQFTQVFGDWQALDAANHELGAHGSDYPTYTGGPGDRVGTLLTLVQGQPPSTARDFLITRLTEYKNFHDWDDTDQLLRVADFLSNGNVNVMYALEAITDQYAALSAADLQEGLRLVNEVVNHYTYDQIGNSEFQGLIYTNGSLLASNQVSVVGAVIVRGDLHLQNGTHVTFLKDLFSEGEGQLTLQGPLHVQTWAGR